MPRLILDDIYSVGLVPEGDNPESEIALFKRRFSQEERDKLAARGLALPDGSFPIRTVKDLRNAVQAFGRAADKTRAKRHIVKRARALGRVDVLPESWEITKSDATVEARRAESASHPTENVMDTDLLDALDDDTRQAVVKALEEADDKIEALEAQVEDLTPPEDPIEKADPEVQAEIRKLREDLDRERNERVTREYTELAKQHPGLNDNDTEPGTMLKRLGEADRQALDWLLEKVKGLEKIASESDLFRTIGKKDGGSAQDQADALAKEKQAQNPDLTDASAHALVYKEYPELVAAIREEEGNL